MTPKPPVDHITKIRDFLKKYHGFSFAYSGDMQGDLHILEFPTHVAEGENMLNHIGATSALERDILGGVVVTRTVNFTLHAIRRGNDKDPLEENAAFMTDFHHWFVEQSILDATPKFGDYEKHREVFSISSGIQWDSREDTLSNREYMWQLQLIYRLFYEE